ncbi:MAG: hypothetical protein JSS49_30395 [Planctomycetes bacterium]|nr:hypothetical protein [Planctomycetota bacterium]
MSGGPVANAIVTFSPKERQPVAIGKTDNDGKFTVTTYDPGDGAAEGDFVVLVTKQSAPQAATVPAHDPSKPFDSSAAHSQSAGAKAAADVGLPEKYSRIDQTDLKVNVKQSGNDFPLELKP